MEFLKPVSGAAAVFKRKIADKVFKVVIHSIHTSQLSASQH
jgi:hypothetical protein